MLNCKIALILLAGGCLWADGLGVSFTSLSPVPSSSQSDSLGGFSDGGRLIALDARHVLMETKRTDKLAQGAALTVIFDRNTGVFWWDLCLFGLREARAEAFAANLQTLGTSLRFYSGGGRIVAFDSRMSFLVIRESKAHAESLNDAEGQAFKLAQAELLSGPGGAAGVRRIDPLGGVDASVYSDTSSAAAYPCYLEGAARLGNDWVLTARCRATVRLFLNENYALNKWERIAE